MSETGQIMLTVQNQQQQLQEHGTKIDSLRDQQTEVISALRGVSRELRKHTETMSTYIERQANSSEKISRNATHIREHAKRITDLELVQAGNAPFVKLIEAVNAKIWMLMLGTIASLMTAVFVAANSLPK